MNLCFNLKREGTMRGKARLKTEDEPIFSGHVEKPDPSVNRLDLNDLLRRSEVRAKEERRVNVLIFGCVVSVIFVVGFLTFAFITGQLLVWQHFVNLGQYASTNPATQPAAIAGLSDVNGAAKNAVKKRVKHIAKNIAKHAVKHAV